MTAAQEAKSHGYKTLAQVAELTGKTTFTLRSWHKDNHRLFKAVLIGFKEWQ